MSNSMHLTTFFYLKNWLELRVPASFRITVMNQIGNMFKVSLLFVCVDSVWVNADKNMVANLHQQNIDFGYNLGNIGGLDEVENGVKKLLFDHIDDESFVNRLTLPFLFHLKQVSDDG
jgi:hypothetical protein